MSHYWEEPLCRCGCGEKCTALRGYRPGHDLKHLNATVFEVTQATRRPDQVRVLEQMDEDLTVAADALAELYLYLNNEKFHTDPTVQVADVLHRLSSASVAVAGYRSPKED